MISSFQNYTQTTSLRVRVSEGSHVRGGVRGLEPISFCECLSCCRNSLNWMSLHSLPTFSHILWIQVTPTESREFVELGRLLRQLSSPSKSCPPPNTFHSICLIHSFKAKIEFFLITYVSFLSSLTFKSTYSLHNSLTLILQVMCPQIGYKL